MTAPAPDRQVVLDVETTGLEVARGNRVIELGCVEIVDRRITGRVLQRYVDPERDIEPGAQRVHGIDRARLRGEPKFAAVLDELLEFVRDADVLIHNAPFDLAFLDAEFQRAGRAEPFRGCCRKVTDTLPMAKELFPGNSSLDQLCDLFEVDRSDRALHGALLDAQLLAQVYLRMTGGQIGLELAARRRTKTRRTARPVRLRVLRADAAERRRHAEFLELLDAACGGGERCLWRELEAPAD